MTSRWERGPRSGHVVLVLDVSGSMDRFDKYPMLRNALEMLLKNIEDGLFVTVVLFSTEATPLREGMPAGSSRSSHS